MHATQKERMPQSGDVLAWTGAHQLKWFVTQKITVVRGMMNAPTCVASVSDQSYTVLANSNGLIQDYVRQNL